MAAVTAVSITACRKIKTDGEPIIVTVPDGGGGTTPTGKYVTLSGHVSKNTTLLTIDNNTFSGLVYVDAVVTLAVEADATVKDAYAGTNTDALIVDSGAKLMAVGTQEKPIIFTSASSTPTPVDWGKIELMGKAAINQATVVHPAYISQRADLVACVGSGITIDHIQVTYAKDDAL